MAVRARQHFQNTVELLPAGDRRSMIAGECMAAVYWRILRALENAKFRPSLDPAPLKLSKFTKLSVLFGVWARTFFKSSSPNYGRD